MAVRGTIPRRLLLPLLVFWGGSAVDSQTVSIVNVTREHFELIWERQGEWLDIGDYTVNTVFSDGTQHPCNNEPFSCTTPVCMYQSLSCGLLNPCSSINVSVSGGNYTARDLFLTTDMVEDFTAEAVSWSVIATTWLPPQCNSDPIVEYTVSLLGISFNRYWVTDQVYTTNYTWNKLRNNNRYTVCVKPVRGNESCLSLNTLLERPNTLRVEDSPRGELLVTWTYYNCPYEGCYSVIYNVSWGTALENFVVTTLKKYTIKGYNAEDPRVCVTAINTDTYAVSTNTCLGDPDVEPIIPTMEPTPSSPANPGLILGLSCAAIILGAGVVVSVVVRIRNRNRLPIIRTTSRPTEVNNAHVANSRQ